MRKQLEDGFSFGGQGIALVGPRRVVCDNVRMAREKMALSLDSEARNRGSRILNRTIMMEREKSRSEALRNECSAPRQYMVAAVIIRFSPAECGVNSAEGFSAIFSPASIFFPLINT